MFVWRAPIDGRSLLLHDLRLGSEWRWRKGRGSISTVAGWFSREHALLSPGWATLPVISHHSTLMAPCCWTGSWLGLRTSVLRLCLSLSLCHSLPEPVSSLWPCSCLALCVIVRLSFSACVPCLTYEHHHYSFTVDHHRLLFILLLIIVTMIIIIIVIFFVVFVL